MFNIKTLIQLKNICAAGSNSLIYDLEEFKEKNTKTINVLVAKANLELDKLVAKVSNSNSLTELEILKKARIDNFTYICFIEGHSEIMINSSCILLHKAERDLKNISRPINETTEKSINLFFDNVLDYLSKLNIVYCDWKPSNILDFGGNNYKLTDFGSCLQCNLKIEHPNNINIIYSSPYLMNIHEGIEITPKIRDDLIGVSYVYLWLKNVTIPWAFYEPKIENNSFSRIIHLIYNSKIDENIHRFKFETMNIPIKYLKCLKRIYEDFKLNDSNKIIV